ncbi:thioredoxin family protein [Daejeonella lutea]|uniref:Thioredoxin-related protein n=1 Tax=Daejeonella lutea TaxID=572036 RepID=A0A1T5ERI2_9SPHI|nr:hypothetical protein [Daejeonella lutea]SKB86468.1 Thioredoxin-related protein [Daejeonella lutea]
MKKSIIVLCALLLCSGIARSQTIKYESSLAKAEKESIAQNKPLSILVTIQPPAFVNNFLSGLQDEQVVKKFNENFVNFKIDRSDSASKEIITKYKLQGFPVFVFVDSKGGLLYQRVGNLPPPMFSAMLDEAMERSKGKSLVEYDRQYASGNDSVAFLKEYINKRINAGITSNADIIEKYVNNLAVRDLNNYNEVLFILKSGPLADGRAYTLVNTNRKMVDSVFKREMYDVRVAINNRIIENTMASAIATKNMARAFAASAFTQRTWNSDFLQGQKSSSARMLQYFSAIKDTTAYFRQAIQHYDRFYMNIGVDSIRKLDRKIEDQARSNANEQAALSRPPGAGIRSVSYAVPSSTTAADLNNGAYNIYMTGTRNQNTLSKAMLWSKRSIELIPNAASYDTLAHILYRLGFHAEALTTQEKAIALAKEEKSDVKQLQDELLKIKNKTL